jgi:hypothetical protein
MADIGKIQRAISRAQAANDIAAVESLQQLLAEAQAAPGPKIETGRSWSDVGSSAASNFLPSLGKFASDLTTAATNPIDTLQAVGDVGAGALRAGAQKVLPETAFNFLDSLGNSEDVQRAADRAAAVGNMYSDRYGSVEGFKKGLSEDPVGVLSDLSLAVGGAGSVAAKAPGIAGKAGKAAKVAADFMDPVSLAAKTARGGGRAISGLVGWTSGVGDEPISAGFNAARAGGVKSKSFYDNMRGNVPITNVVDEGVRNIDNIRQNAQSEYRRDIQSSMQNVSPINWNPIFQSMQDAIKSLSTKSGRFYGGPAGKAMVQDVLKTIQQYVMDPALHNVEGLDALKKELSGLQITPGPSVKTGQAQANRIVTSVLDGIRKEIERVDPKYAATMERYAEMSDLMEQLQRTLRLDPKATVDTTLRQLQSTMRNNVQTNYGARGQLLDELDAAGAGTLRPALAGQSFNTWAPRGIARAGGAYAIPAAIAWMASNPAMALGTVAGFPAAMPRVVGEVTGLLGAGARKADQFAQAAPLATKTAREISSRPGRTAIRNAGAITNEVDAMIEDAKGNVYDRKGRLIRRGQQ